MSKKIWSDPVWSKVISAIIIAIGSFIIALIYGAVTDFTVEQSLIFIWNYTVKLGPTILAIISGLIILAIIQQFFKKRPSKKEKLETEFHNKYRKIDDTDDPIRYRFNAYISTYTKFPFISDLRVYCTAHDNGEILMSKHAGCPIQNCDKHNMSYNEHSLKTQIETNLLGEWERMNN